MKAEINQARFRESKVPAPQAGSALPRAEFDADSPPHPGTSRKLQVRLAQSESEVQQAQALRYHVFYRTGAATPAPETAARGRDCDRFDAFCDHLLVIDGEPDNANVVATYRLLRQDVATQHGGFYSQREFDLDGLLRRKQGLHFLELGRSCVLPLYRDKGAVELLWRGIWAYCLRHTIDVMIGCASLPGTDAERLAPQLRLLHQIAGAPPEWAVQPRPGQSKMIIPEMLTVGTDRRTTLRDSPPLLRAYIRLGAMISDSAVIDSQFGVTDVFAVLPVALIKERYIRHFGVGAASLLD